MPSSRRSVKLGTSGKMWSVKAVTTAWSLASGHHLVEAGVGRVWQPAALFEALDYAVLDRPQDRDELGEGGDVVW